MKLNNFTRVMILNIILLLFFILLMIFTQIPILADAWTTTIARGYHLSIAWFFSLVPFSLMEFVIVGWAVLVLFFLMKNIQFAINKNWSSMWMGLQKVLLVILIMINGYVATAGLAYARLPLPLPQYQNNVAYTTYTEVVSHYRDRFNSLAETLTFADNGSVMSPYSTEELSEKIIEAYDRAELSDYFTSYSTRIKPLTTSFLYREFHITGVHFAPTTEATINVLIPDALKPFTMAHELAHAKGVMREQDANLVALYVCLLSDDPYVQYSGLFNSFYTLLNLLRYIGEPTAYQQMYQTLSLDIRKDYAYQNAFWSQYDLLDTFARWVNDTYLKIFGNDGVSSYVDVPDVITIVDGENTIDVISEFSPFQKLFFYFYFT
jgi:hypothetical protein